MKKKISISVSQNLLKLIDSLPDSPARSQVIEEALIFYFKSRKAQAREKKDLDIFNTKSKSLNDKALDVLEYQSD
ncbi:MAG TPA: hypothetical protein VJB34_02860 [Bdellovibrionota bacterium]|nr:hypothetical protein [Bdellovibrionota bacterium]